MANPLAGLSKRHPFMEHKDEIGTFMFKIQKGTNKAQLIPVLGPAIISPVKGTVSILEAIYGVVGGIFLTLLNLPLKNEKIDQAANHCWAHAKQGGKGLAYSALNMVSLGTASWIVEIMSSTEKQEQERYHPV